MKTITMEEIYRQLPRADIPWDIQEPPDALIDLIKSGTITPCKTIDLGCGYGNYSIYMATKGFEVTGIDISSTVIDLARENADQRGVTCKFITLDVLGNISALKEKFDFAFDWELLHHLSPTDRELYIKNVSHLLKPGGRYFSICFSEQDPQFGGSGKYRETPIGTVLYFSNENELKELFSEYFIIDELKTIEIQGKHAPHLAVYALMTRR